ncbi:hypothetical protein [Pseudogracilibacillus sp. SO30301A]|uniref:hypothetical protein n=1 Tax=Pseudogracilibacillus sp. SO30301A TaxID=3098291 RepID=UPI00300E05F1
MIIKNKLIDSVSDAMDEVIKIDEIGSLLSVVNHINTEANEVNESTKQINMAVEQVAVTAKQASS